jgi:large conductance mechanosensitive channel
MSRIRDLLAHGGLAPLAALFAISFAIVGVAEAVSQVVIAVIAQHTADPDGGSGFDFRILSTNFDLLAVTQTLLVFLAVAALLWCSWRLTRTRTRECPECLSEVPRHARVCRFCTADLLEPLER